MRLGAFRDPLVAIGLATLLMIATAGRVNAADPKFVGAKVTPMIGTTTSTFQFSVQFQPGTEVASTVSVTVAGTSFPLAHDHGQTWIASRTLPVGSWTATFTGTTESGVNPDPVSVSPIVVTAPTPAPTATSPPTPPPPPPTATPRPTPRPTSVPATATPVPGTSVTPAVSPTPFGTTVTDPSGSPPGSAGPGDPSSSPSPSRSPGADAPAPRPLNVPIEGVVAIGLLGAVAAAAALGERRRRAAVQAFREAEASEGVSRGDGLEEGWADDIVDDETVATIDYEAPTDRPDPDA